MIVKCRITGKKIEKVSFLPVMINTRAQPTLVARDDKEFEDALRYIQDISESQELGTRFSVEGGEIVVTT